MILGGAQAIGTDIIPVTGLVTGPVTGPVTGHHTDLECILHTNLVTILVTALVQNRLLEGIYIMENGTAPLLTTPIKRKTTL